MAEPNVEPPNEKMVSANVGHLVAVETLDDLGISPAQRYELASELFPDWLKAEPVQIPTNHPTLRWHCFVPQCGASPAGVLEVCTDHRREMINLSVSLEQFTKTAAPKGSLEWGWALTRKQSCACCPEREAHVEGYCHACHIAMERASQSYGADFDKTKFRQGRAPAAPHSKCAVAKCVHDVGRHQLCSSHFQRYSKDLKCDLDLEWVEWVQAQVKSPSVRPWRDRGQLSLIELTGPVQQQVRYAIWKIANDDHSPRTNVEHLRTVIQWLAEHDVIDVNHASPPPKPPSRGKKKAQTDYETSTQSTFKRVVKASQPVSVSAQESMEQGWFDPILVGAKPFISEGTRIRYSPLQLKGIGRRWLRDLTWMFLRSEALKRKPRRAVNLIIKIRSVVILSQWLEHNDAPSNPADFTAATATGFKNYLNTCLSEEIPLPGLNGEPVKNPPTKTNLALFTANVLEVLNFAHGGKTAIDAAFLLNFPTFEVPRHQPAPRPFDDETWNALADPDNLRQLDELDRNDTGYVDIWLTHLNHASRIGEVLGLTLGCLGRVGSTPYLWRDITKIGQVDHGVPCHPLIYSRLEAREEKTRRKLRARYQHELAELTPKRQAAYEAEWDKTKPLFPRHSQNHNLALHTAQVFMTTFRAWVEQIDLPASVTTHQARHTLATKLLNNGAPAELVSELLGHVSQRMLRSYATYSDINRAKHLTRVWAAGPGMDHPGEILATPDDFRNGTSQSAIQNRINQQVIPVEHGGCTFSPVVGGADCPWNQQCTSNSNTGPCDHFILTGADLVYHERRLQSAITFAEGAPSEDARDYMLQALQGWDQTLAGLRHCLVEMDLIHDAESLDLRNPSQDYLNNPLWNTGWRWRDLAPQDSTEVLDVRERPKDTSHAEI